MSDLRQAGKAGRFWAEYQPDPVAPWDRRRVVHLHRRAGFAATWREIERDLTEGPRASIDRLLAGEARNEVASTEFEQRAGKLADAIRTGSCRGGFFGWYLGRTRSASG
jgi:hypothetical protein